MGSGSWRALTPLEVGPGAVNSHAHGREASTLQQASYYTYQTWKALITPESVRCSELSTTSTPTVSPSHPHKNNNTQYRVQSPFRLTNILLDNKGQSIHFDCRKQ